MSRPTDIPSLNPGAELSEKTSLLEIPVERRPRHIAVIMDGNGRWAQRQDLPRIAGHEKGAISVRAVTEECARLQIEQLTINALDRVHLRASRNLDINGLELSQSLPSLIMEATTIRLSNIDFPGNTSVQLNSLKGPIDGRYPNFGSSIPFSEQVGRVNFLQNVSSGGNALIDRPSFDQFGGNISIGKFLP